MTDHTEIPADVMETAGKIFNEALNAPTTNNEDIKVIARAILKERERCARIAEAEWVWPNTAAAIRGSVDK